MIAEQPIVIVACPICGKTAEAFTNEPGQEPWPLRERVENVILFMDNHMKNEHGEDQKSQSASDDPLGRFGAAIIAPFVGRTLEILQHNGLLPENDKPK